MFIRIAIAVVAAILLPTFWAGPVATANASSQPRLIVTSTQSVVGSGSTRTVSHTVTVVDTQGALTSGIPTGNQVRVFFASILCNSPRSESESTWSGLINGCRPLVAVGTTITISPTLFQQNRSIGASWIDRSVADFPYLVARIMMEDSSGTRLFYFANAVENSVVVAASGLPSQYLWPEITWPQSARPITAGNSLSFVGKRLDAIMATSIGSLPATISSNSASTLTVTTPTSLAPGTYDLTMQTPFGTITKINAVRIKVPTQPRILTFKSSAMHLNEQNAQDLATFHESLNSDYEKVRCIVNSADQKTAQKIARLTCMQIARGELRNVEVIQESRNSFSGRGFWVRIYATG